MVNAQSTRKPEFWTSGQCADAAGISAMSVNRLYDSGTLSGHRLHGTIGARRIDRAAFIQYMGLDDGATVQDTPCESTDGLWVIYARCSQTKDKGQNLVRQTARLTAWMKANYPGQKYIVYSELASGLNSDRPKMGKIIDMALEGAMKGGKLIAEHKDRISRGSYAMLSRVLEKCGVEIVLTNTGESENQGKNAIEELIFDACAAMYVANSKIYGSRASQKIRFVASPELEARIAILMGEGRSKRSIIQQIESEDWHCLNTQNKVKEHGCRLVIDKIRTSQPTDVPPIPVCIQTFIASNCRLDVAQYAMTKALYTAFAVANPVEAASMSPRKFIDTLRVVVPHCRIERGSNGHRFYGLCLKGKA